MENYSSARELDRDRDVLVYVLDDLSSRFPPNWDVSTVLEPTSEGPDAFMRITSPDGSSAQIAIEAKVTLEPRNVRSVLSRLSASPLGSPDALPPDVRPLVIARYLAPRTRSMLADADASYADATGNVRIRLDRPSVFIETQGASSNPWREEPRAIKRLRGAPAARVVRALCDWYEPVAAVELAKRAGTSVGSTYRVLDFLDREALIVRRGKGEVLEVDWVSLIRRWTKDYIFAELNRVSTYVAPRGLGDLLDRVRAQPGIRTAVTGSLSAARVSEYAEARLGAVYVDDRDQAARLLGLTPARTGANVLLAEPFDEVVYQRSTRVDGVSYCAFSQTAADLLTSPGRGPAEGEELLRWMQDHEPTWRL